MVKTQYVDANLLDEYIERSGFKIGHIIEKLGISRASWHKKKTGAVAMRGSEVYVLCDLLNIPKEEQSKIFCFKVEENA